MTVDFRDIVIAELADGEAELRDQVKALVDVIADLAWENHWLSVVADRAFQHPYQRRVPRSLPDSGSERQVAA